MKAPVELVDVFPTLFDLANVKQSDQTDGKSLATLMDKNPKNDIKPVIALSQYPREDNKKMGYSIRTERYRYTEWHENKYNTEKPYDATNIMGVELYDYVSDPLELKNHANESNYTVIAKDLQSKLKGKLNEVNKRNIYPTHPSSFKGKK